MSKISIRNLLIRVSLGAIVATGAPLHAQVAGEPAEETGLGDIVVTARRVAENQQDVPVAVTVLSGQELRTRNVQNLVDVAQFTPGLSTRGGASSAAAFNVTLRGMVQTDQLATLDPSVGTYVDGVNWARAYGLNGSILDVSAVQVLKGPQGTLFGRNTTGGAILISTNDPVIETFSGRLSGTYGRFNERQLDGFINVPLGEKLAIRVAGLWLKRDGYTLNTAAATASTAVNPAAFGEVGKRPPVGSPNGRKFNERDRQSVRGKILFKPTETLSLLVSGEYYNSDDSSPANQIRLATTSYTASNSTFTVGSTSALYAGILSGGPAPTSAANAAASTALGLGILTAEAASYNQSPRMTRANEVPYSKARTHTYNFIGTLDTDWGQIKLISGYRRVRTSALTDLDGSSFPIALSAFKQRLTQKSIEVQTTGKAFEDRLDFAAGAFAFHEQGYDQSLSITVPLLNPISQHQQGRIDNDSIGVYSQATYHFTDTVSATGGLRYSVDDKGLDQRNNGYNRTSGVTTCQITGMTINLGAEIVGPRQCSTRRRDSFGGWSYTAGLEWKPTDDILLYVKTSKGFRSGGQNLRAATIVSFIPFGPEVAYSHEIGVKSEFLDRRLRVNAALFTSDVKGLQRTTLVPTAPIPPSTVGGTATIISNAGKARYRGGEIEVQALVAEGLRLSASAAYVHPKYVKFADLTGDRRFERFQYVPKRQFALAADYTTLFTSDVRFNLHIDYTWRSDLPTWPYQFPQNPQNSAIVAATTAPAIGLLGARAALEIGDNYEIAVFGRNITNEQKFINATFVAPLGFVAGSQQEPRTFGVTGTVKF